MSDKCIVFSFVFQIKKIVKKIGFQTLPDDDVDA